MLDGITPSCSGLPGHRRGLFRRSGPGYQGLIAALSSFLEPFLQASVVAEMTCVGSLLIIALSLNMLRITKIKVMNIVPAIFLPILLCPLM